MEPSSTPLDLLSQTEQCVVCGDSADGFHYGVRSCRGCNAFFRRAVTFNMSFACRRGGNCPVDKNARCACRACRLAKCYSVGMDKKAVQPKKEAHNGHASTNEEEYEKVRKIRTSLRRLLLLFTPLSAQLSADVFLPAIPPSPPPDCSPITRQCYDYAEQKRRRRSMLCFSLEEILSVDCDTGLRGIANALDYARIFQVQMVLMFEWVEKLPEFRLLQDPLDKTKLLRAFALRYILLDNVFHTIELGYSDRVVFVNNNFIIPGQQASMLGVDVLDEQKVRKLMYGQEMREILEELIIPITNMQLTIGEMMTLRKIMFWNPGNVSLSSQGTQDAQEASNTAVKELNAYFETECIDNVETRIGNLLLLIPSFSKHVRNMYETVKLIPSFGRMQEWNAFMDDLLSGV
ncbi:unnamed protein product [Caenorhabditis auriculariae]|uniref:Uncharacterized protein n=1 Tax=Caenorhabditis auriculariae TaxID=2777116 RepID=A0A8S1GVB6_9PELO|nr:unnamed protein product [Caenorhabditis auriculariae]